MCENEQLTFGEELIELPLVKQLNNIISEICIKQNVEIKYVHCNSIKDGYSVWICEPTDLKETYRVFNVIKKDTKKTHRYEVSISYRRAIAKDAITAPSDAELVIKEEKHKDENKNIYIVNKAFLYFPLESTELISYLRDVLDYGLAHFEPSNKIGCCGLYIKCSDAKKCLHRENFYARACYYRKNLEAGRIFYGKNAT